MLLQVKHIKKNKKGLSIIIGYILIMTVSVVMSIIVYQWIKTYAPRDTLQCPDGVSLFVKDFTCEKLEGVLNKNLTLVLINNGKFSIDGYFIRVSTDSNLDNLATIDLSEFFYGSAVQVDEGIVRFENGLSISDNFFAPGKSTSNKFDITSISGTIKKIELIPSRIETINNFKRTAICDGASVETVISC